MVLLHYNHSGSPCFIKSGVCMELRFWSICLIIVATNCEACSIDLLANYLDGKLNKQARHGVFTYKRHGQWLNLAEVTCNRKLYTKKFATAQHCPHSKQQHPQLGSICGLYKNDYSR